jgi:NADH-quinone oxidoreductase subunit N
LISAEIPNIIPALPELFISLIILALLMLGVFHKTGGKEDIKASRLISLLSIISLLLAILLVTSLSGGRVLTFTNLFISDSFSTYCKVLILIGSSLALVLSFSFQEKHNMARFEFAILILFATLGMMMMVSANDLISLYMGLELQSLSLYVIAAFQRDDTKSTEAGLKYFVLGAVASGMLLYGSSLIYGFTGTTNFDQLTYVFQSHNSKNEISIGIVFGIVFILAGLAFKISAVPFHMWTPDVYEGAPTPVTAFFSVAPKIAALALLIRVMVGPFGGLVEHWQQIVIFISIASMTLGAFAAINQHNIKRLMAYSSIGHVGYALIGIAVGGEAGVRSVLIYLAIYLFMNIGIFACILNMSRDGNMVEQIDDLTGLSRTHPMMSIAFAVFMFSMAGIPPFAGFFGKLHIFMSAVQANMYGLAILGVLTSVVAAFYYIRIVQIIYFKEPEATLDQASGTELNFVITTSGLLVTFFFIFSTPILSAASTAAASLFSG